MLRVPFRRKTATKVQQKFGMCKTFDKKIASMLA